VSADAHTLDRVGAGAPWRSRAWGIVSALSVTETVSYGILYYAFAVFLLPMQRELEFSAAQLTGAFSVAVLVSGVAWIAVGHYLDRHGPRGLITGASAAGALLVPAWSQVHGPAAFYALWVAIGLVMAAVLYEPAFTVLAKRTGVTEARFHRGVWPRKSMERPDVAQPGMLSSTWRPPPRARALAPRPR